jgi:phosphate butyryltransferase
MIENFAQLIEVAKKKGPKKLIVAAAEDDVVLEAVKMAVDQKIIEPILVGNEPEIKKIASQLNMEIPWPIIHQPDPTVSPKVAVEEIRNGKAEIIMKGLVGTPILLKAILDKEKGLAKSKVLSHVGLIGTSTYRKLMIMTDGGMVPAPTLDEKIEILKNAIIVARALGISPIKVAVCSSVETVSNKVVSTMDAAILAKMGDRKQFGKDVIIDGPLAMDNAVNKHAAEHKGIVSEVAGDADVLLMPNIESGNIFYKALVYLGNCNAETAGIVLGAKVPVIVPSRSDTAESKLNAIAASVLIAGI